jgi:quinol monooxygenase YgiN
MTILVTGTIDFDPAKREEAIAAVKTAMEATLTEDGCEGYTFSGDLTNEGRFIINEQWASQDAMDTHMQSPNLAALMAAWGECGVTGVSLTKWDGATPSKLM